LKKLLENPSAPPTDVAISQYPRRDPDTGTDLMGYSIRDSRWRATLWRDRNGPKIIATELYDEQNDPAETVSLADRPERKALLEWFAKHLPPAGSAAIDKNAPKGKKEKDADSKVAASKAASPVEGDDRSVRFDKIDKEKAGKLSREVYLASQSNAEAAAERFEKWDTNKDGFLSREEFVTMGKK
jgi:hypothetical protein